MLRQSFFPPPLRTQVLARVQLHVKYSEKREIVILFDSIFVRIIGHFHRVGNNWARARAGSVFFKVSRKPWR